MTGIPEEKDFAAYILPPHLFVLRCLVVPASKLVYMNVLRCA